MAERRILPNTTPIQCVGDPSAPRAMIVIQEAFGVTDHIVDVAAHFADEGYYAVVPELFHRVGSPVIAYDDFASARPAMESLHAAGLHDDLIGTGQYLHSQGYGPASIGIVGFCMGGLVAYYAGTLGIVGAAVTYYGSGITEGRFGFAPMLEMAHSLQCAWLGFYGDQDAAIPVEQVEALRAATAATPYPTDIVRYAEAGHGFNRDVWPDAYREGPSRDSRQRATTFFADNLATK